MSIAWRGSLKRSVIRLGFHYERTAENGCPWTDREGLGTLIGFKRSDWTTTRDTAMDARLSGYSLASAHAVSPLIGNHGDRRQFVFAGHLWRVYEAQEAWPAEAAPPKCSGFGGDFGKFHLFLYDVPARRLYPLAMTFPGHSHPYWTSFGNTTVRVLPAPHGTGHVLVVSMFVFSGPPNYGGEIIYYTPI